MDNLTETSAKDLLTTASEVSDIAHWSDERRNDFCNTFEKRVRVAKYILLTTAEMIREGAERRQFISNKHNVLISKGLKTTDRHGFSNKFGIPSFFPELRDRDTTVDWDRRTNTIGGRTCESLDLIADERAKAILSNLPPLRQAVEVIDAETAKKIGRKEKLLADAKKTKTELEEASEDIVMADLDQKMTIGAFRDLVKARDAKRKALIRKLSDISEEGGELEKEIAKALYAGLPGLSDAVVESVRTHIDQAIGLDEMLRRVTEQVKFGDSESALSLLRHFEQDEVTISDNVKQRFAEALEKLKLTKKALPTKATTAKKKAN